MWQKGHLQCLAVPCPPLEVPRQLGLTLPQWLPQCSGIYISHAPLLQGGVQKLNPDSGPEVTQGLGQPRLSGRGKLARLA